MNDKIVSLFVIITSLSAVIYDILTQSLETNMFALFGWSTALFLLFAYYFKSKELEKFQIINKKGRSHNEIKNTVDAEAYTNGEENNVCRLFAFRKTEVISNGSKNQKKLLDWQVQGNGSQGKIL